MLRSVLASGSFAALLCVTSAAYADMVAVLPFSAPASLSKPEADRAQAWTREAVVRVGHTLPGEAAMLSAEMAVKDRVADTSEEYRAAGRASGSGWTLTGRITRHDTPPKTLADGTTEEEGFTTYRIELEACFVESGRVESLAREIDPDEAPAQVAEMLALLLRAEGIANVPLPWHGRATPRKRKPREEPRDSGSEKLAPEAANPRHVYAENHPVAVGIAAGFSTTAKRPDGARGPSEALPVGIVFGYAIEQVPGLEARGVFTNQVLGPRALAIAAGGRYAIPVLARYRVFVGPELLLGSHVALGAEKVARLLVHGSGFVSIGVGERVQLEAAADVAGAFGGTGTLVLTGGTGRALFRF